jgi:hypothetical protein
MTETELNDVVSQILNNDATASRDAVALVEAMKDSLFSEKIAAVAEVANAEPLLSMSPLGERKERSPKETSTLTRDTNYAKQAALVQAAVPVDTRTPSPPREGTTATRKTTGDGTSTYYNCWLDLIDQRNYPVEVKDISHARVNLVLPILLYQQQRHF